MTASATPSATHAALTLARFVLLEARRTRLPILVVLTVAAAFGLAAFLSQLALTESTQLQVAVLGAFFRLSCVFLCVSFVATSMVRESNDKGTDLLLSLPISRTAFYLGKLAGFGAFGVLVAATFSIVLLVWSPPAAVGAWFLSLSLEVWLVAAVSLFFVVTLAEVVSALAATAGLYLLGRTVGSLQAISSSPIATGDDFVSRIAGWGIDGVALILPPLGHATQTNWLLYAPPSLAEFVQISGSLVVYAALITAAGLFDFHRRNL